MPFALNATPNPQNVWEAILQGESQQIELKKSVESVLELARDVSAFANADGGWLIIGVREPNVLLGVDRRRLDWCFENVHRRAQNAPDLLLHYITIKGHEIGVVVVKPSRVRVITDAGAYQREGVENRVIPRNELQPAAQKATIPDQAKLLDSIAEMTIAINGLLNTQKESHGEIVTLGTDWRKSQTIRGQLKGWLISGVIGFFFGFAASFLANHFELLPWLDMHKSVAKEEAPKPAEAIPLKQP